VDYSDSQIRSLKKKVFLRLAVLFVSMSIGALLLHFNIPFGPHRFFWNLAPGALVFHHIAIAPLRHYIKLEPDKPDPR